MSLSVEFADVVDFDFQQEEESQEGIYVCLSEPPILTVIIGAKCSDGVVLIADKKMTKIGGEPQFKDKIFGDLAHFPLAYTGKEDVFHVFRKAMVGEWLLKFNNKEPLGLEEVMPTYASIIRPINGMSSQRRLEVLVGKHSKKNTDLYHIISNGEYSSMSYAAIGSGKDVANKICHSF